MRDFLFFLKYFPWKLKCFDLKKITLHEFLENGSADGGVDALLVMLAREHRVERERDAVAVDLEKSNSLSSLPALERVRVH